MAVLDGCLCVPEFFLLLVFWRSHFGLDLPHHTSLTPSVSAAVILVLHE